MPKTSTWCRVDRHECRVDRHECRVDRHKCRVDRHKCRVDRHECRVDRHECRVDRHECRVDRHECRVDRHKCRVDRHKCRVDRHQGVGKAVRIEVRALYNCQLSLRECSAQNPVKLLPPVPLQQEVTFSDIALITVCPSSVSWNWKSRSSHRKKGDRSAAAEEPPPPTAKSAPQSHVGVHVGVLIEPHDVTGQCRQFKLLSLLV